jgi:hypothetical protein
MKETQHKKVPICCVFILSEENLLIVVLNVIMLSVVMLNVVAPKIQQLPDASLCSFEIMTK